MRALNHVSFRLETNTTRTAKNSNEKRYYQTVDLASNRNQWVHVSTLFNLRIDYACFQFINWHCKKSKFSPFHIIKQFSSILIAWLQKKLELMRVLNYVSFRLETITTRTAKNSNEKRYYQTVDLASNRNQWVHVSTLFKLRIDYACFQFINWHCKKSKFSPFHIIKQFSSILIAWLQKN